MIWRSLSLLAAVFMAAPTVQLASHPAPSPRVRIDFGNDVSHKKVWLEYGLYSQNGQNKIGLGGPSSNFGLIPTGAPFWEIEASVDGEPADRFKALVWAPGCQMKEFDVPVGTSSLNLSFRCDKVPTHCLVGRLKEVDRGIRSEVSVWYTSLALCPFFMVCKQEACGFSCLATSIPEIANAEVESDGTFKIEVTDLSADPIASSDAELQLSFHDIVLAPGHPNYRYIPLEPESQDYRTESGGLKMLRSYSGLVVFVAKRGR